MDELLQTVVARYNYWVYIALMMVGLYGIIAKRNLVKKIIGIGIMQTAIILFYVSIAAKRGATIPIIEHGHGAAAHETAVRAVNYINPLPHVLMLTAIVVSVATLGVALALAVKVHGQYHTLDEDDILEQIRKSNGEK
jgi:multicomponent Na+:H+ antiporter subunit C